MSFVVVFPTDPVTPTTGSAASRRTWRARSERPLVVSATRTRGRPGGAGASRWTRAARAPRPAASARKSWPSNRGPLTATKRAPASIVRESMETEAKAISCAAGAASAPWVAARTSARVRAARSATAVTSSPRPGETGEDVARHLAVVERHGAVAQHLVGLVALARDHHHDPLPAHLQGAGDGVPAVGDDERVGGPRRRDAAPDLLEDRLRGLAAGVVRGEDDDVGEPRRHRPHERPLGAVAVAPAAEDGDDAPGGEPPHGLEQVLERVVGVRVVHEDGEVLAGEDALHAAGDSGERRDPALHRVLRQAEGEPRPEGGEGVLDVEGADERGLHVEDAEGRPRAEARPLERQPHVLGEEVRPRVPEGEGPDRPPARARELGGALVVEVQHGVAVVAQEPLEEHPLRREVGVHVAVVVEVVAGEVREDGDPELEAVDALEGERVRGHLEHGAPAPGVHHLPEEGLEVRRLGRRAHRLGDAVAHAVLDGADEAHRLPGGAEGRVHEVRRRRLAVRAGDADEVELARRVPEDRRGERGEGRPRVGHAHPRPLAGGRRLGADGDGALLPRRLHELVAVGDEAADGHEERAGPRAARVVRDVRDLEGGVAAELRPGEAGEEVLEPHGLSPPPGPGSARRCCPARSRSPARGSGRSRGRSRGAPPRGRGARRRSRPRGRSGRGGRA